jgi:hypothetical protein
VTLDKTFRELTECLRKLRDSFLAIQLTVREDLPSEGSVVLVDKFGDAVDDSLGWLEEALTAAVQGERAVAPPANMELARRALSSCQEYFHRMQNRFQSELVSYERLKDLTAFGRSRRGEWSAWVKSFKSGLEQCQSPMERASRCLSECWQEIAERAAMTSVSVQSTNIGQQIATSEADELVRRGVT